MERKFYIDPNDNRIYTFENNQKYNIEKNTNTDEMKVAIVGSRSINDWFFVKLLFDCFIYIFGIPTKIISGGAIGVDSFAGEYAGINKIELQIFRPNWAKYGRKAGFIRNEDIIKNCDICLAIWDGESSGTKHDLELCKQYKKDLVLFNLKESTQGTFHGFYYKQYDKEQEINFSVPVITHDKQIHNRWLPQPGIISV